MKRGNKFERTTIELKSWRDKIWTVWGRDTWYEGLIHFIHFCNRNAAIMWPKRYGKENITYRLERQRGLMGTA